MKQGTTFFLRGAIIAIGIIALGLCLLALPSAIHSDDVVSFRFILAAIYLTMIPFFMALHQSLKLLGYIDMNNAFSDLSVDALNCIKYCAGGIGVFYLLWLPYIYIVAQRDDAPGLMALGIVFVFASAIIATFAAVLQKLLANAIAIKSENDLTV